MAHTILMYRNYNASHMNDYIETTPTNSSFVLVSFTQIKYVALLWTSL